MFANFVICIGTPVRSPAVPLNGVVREGDGTKTVWVTADRRRFTSVTVKIGEQRDGYGKFCKARRPVNWSPATVPSFSTICWQARALNECGTGWNQRSAVLKGILAFGLTRRAIVMLGLLVFIAGGLVAFTRLNIEAYPNPAPVILEITARRPVCPPKRWSAITRSLWRSVSAATPGSTIIRSTSFYGLSFVRVTFKYGVDYYFAYTQAALSLQQNVSLPNNWCRRSRHRAWSAKSIATRWSGRRISV